MLISNVELADLVSYRLGGAVSIEAILDDLDAYRNPLNESKPLSTNDLVAIVNSCAYGWMEAIEC